MSTSPLSLSGLFIYPVKSLRGVSLHEADIQDGRLAGDRRWVVVDSAGRFMHQRDYPLTQSTILFIAVLFMTINLAVDVLYGYLDPRIRYTA